ncbi:MAG: hypothetical protein H6810_08905 [Phycisphaeraceae bacterium]|nr:MAG: hypothetical protein H6810_08905 [Phycisphaeraceae bacterium]
MLALVCLCPVAGAGTYHLYFLGGQSNMDGYGYVNELPTEMQGPVEGVMIFCGHRQRDGEASTGQGIWAPLTPGFGAGCDTDGQSNHLGDRFGPELTFARRLRMLRPDEKIAIIKYARGGSSLDVRVAGGAGTWDPHDTRGSGALRGVNQYDHALAAIRSATAVRDIDGDGEDDTLVPSGILWMQGETDGTNEATANAYAGHLAGLAELLRAAMRVDELPFVIGRISDRAVNLHEGERIWAFGDTVRAAEDKVAADDAAAAIVTSTDNYGYSDPWHYDTPGYIDFGRKFAEAMDGLMGNP